MKVPWMTMPSSWQSLVNFSATSMRASLSTTQSNLGALIVDFALTISGRLVRAWAQIGVSVRDAASGTDGAPGLGATVAQVTAGGPGSRAGLQAGDLVTKVGERVVTDADSLIVAVRANDPGTTVPVTYQRDGQTRTTTVTLAAASSG